MGRNPHFERWTRFRSLTGAWERLRAKDLAPGIDGVRASDFARQAVLDIDALYDELRTGRYRSLPLRCFQMDVNGKRREFAVPAFRDRVVQEALRPTLEEALSPRLSPHCHGYVKGRSTLTAQHDAAAQVQAGRTWVHGCDVEDGFGSIDRKLLADAVTRLLDGRTAEFVTRVMEAGRQRNGACDPPPPSGIPLGQPLSPTCFNVMLLPVDEALQRRNIGFVRYADDILVAGTDEADLDRNLAVLDEALAAVGMRRKVSKDRRDQVMTDPFRFLGRFLAAGRVLQDVPPPESVPPAVAAAITGEGPPMQAPAVRTLYLQTDGTWVRMREGHACVQQGADLIARIPMRDIERVAVLGNVSFTSGFLSACLGRRIPVHFLAARSGGPAFGTLSRSDAESPLRVRSQIESLSDPTFRLSMSRAFVLGKVANSRWLLRRLRAGRGAVAHLGDVIRRGRNATTVDQLLGCEGDGAACHFHALRNVVRADMGFTGRSRRPPRDPFNSLLSFGYALLFNELHTLLIEHRMSPDFGYLHALRDGHPALASDLMEEFRAPIVDRLCVRLANLRILGPGDFMVPRQDGAVLMKPESRRRYLARWEEALEQPLCRRADGSAMDARRTFQRQVRRLMDVVLSGSGVYQPFDATKEFVGTAADMDEPRASEVAEAMAPTGAAEPGEPSTGGDVGGVP